MPTKKSEHTEKVFHPGRKAVNAEDVVATIEAYESDIREYQNRNGNAMDNTMTVMNLKKMLPEVIRERLETLDLQSYAVAKGYAIKQARALKKEPSSKPACSARAAPGARTRYASHFPTPTTV